MSGAPGPGPGRSPLPCAPRPAAVLQLGGGAEPARPGVAVIDLRFPRGAAADVQEIVFRNFYTAFLSVRVQRPGPAGSRRWVTCLRDYCLMPCPHTEEGSQNYFSLHRHQMLCDVDQVTAVRFILRQPSPVWLHFTIEELQIFPRGQKVSRCPCCPTTTRQEVQDRPPSPSPVPGIAPYSSRGFRHPPEDTGEWVQVLVLRWGTWGPLMCWGPGDRLLQPPPALPVLEVDVCLSSGTELEAAAPNYRLQTPNLNTKFPFSKAHLIPIPT
ncbi:nicolin-1 isoform 5-T5 [Alca torda]